MKQLTLPFAEELTYATEDFCPAPSNATAREWLARTDDWSNGRLVLWGEPGCGKTHLLHIWAQARNAEIMNSAGLHGLHRAETPIALDDADIAPDPLALLHLLNNAAEAGSRCCSPPACRPRAWPTSWPTSPPACAPPARWKSAPLRTSCWNCSSPGWRATPACPQHRGAQRAAAASAPAAGLLARGRGQAGPRRPRPGRPHHQRPGPGNHRRADPGRG